MNVFTKIGNFFRELQGSRRCPTPEALIAYMREKQGKRAEAYDALHFWVETRMWYVSDEAGRQSKPWRQNWTPLAKVLARDVPGKEIESDCEERAMAKARVINVLKWGHAEILCTQCQNVLNNHAVCIAWDAKGIRVMDYQMRVYPLGTDITAIVKSLYPDAQTYCYCDEEGHATTQKYLVRMTI